MKEEDAAENTSRLTVPEPPQETVTDQNQEWLSETVPQHAYDAMAAYLAELDALLAHLEENPSERWVAYRGNRRLGFGSDKYSLYCECERKFPDREFCIYGIDAVIRSKDIEV